MAANTMYSKPYLPVGFYFRLEFSGVKTSNDAAFQEVSGISSELEIEEIPEGGEGRFKHKVPKAAKYTNLVLKRGLITSSSQMAEWCRDTIGSDFSLPIALKDIKVVLLNTDAKPLMSWSFMGAWPVKWSISDFKSQENALAIETLEFAYQYFKKDNN